MTRALAHARASRRSRAPAPRSASARPSDRRTSRTRSSARSVQHHPRPVRRAGRAADAPYIRPRIAAGDSKAEIKAQLVAEFGESVLAAPPKRGFGLLAWLLPLLALGVAVAVVGVLVWRWSRGRGRATSGPARPGARAPARRRARSVRGDLRPPWRASCRSRSSPGCSPSSRPACCRSSRATSRRVSAVEAEPARAPGTAAAGPHAPASRSSSASRSCSSRSARSAAVAEVVDKQTQTRIAGFVLVVFGLAFMGLLPLPERIVGATLLAARAAAARGALLGGAFAICAAPCIGPVLASVLVVAGEAGSVAEAASCSPPTRPASPPRSRLAGSPSRARWVPSAGCATTRTSSRS